MRLSKCGRASTVSLKQTEFRARRIQPFAGRLKLAPAVAAGDPESVSRVPVRRGFSPSHHRRAEHEWKHVASQTSSLLMQSQCSQLTCPLHTPRSVKGFSHTRSTGCLIQLFLAGSPCARTVASLSGFFLVPHKAEACFAIKECATQPSSARNWLIPDFTYHYSGWAYLLIVCPQPPKIQFATVNINKEGYSPGEEIIYRCNPGYIPQSGSRRYTCTSSGRWPVIALKCIPRKCPYPGPLANGQIHIIDLNFLSTINFSCDPGFLLHGPTSSQCLVDGRWSAELPECQTVICPPPPVSEFGALSYHRIKPGNISVFQDVIQFECLLPLALFGSETATCQADGSWSALPECRSVECPPPGAIENGFINFVLLSSTFHYQDTVSYGCNYPYILDGGSNSKCEKTGSWSNKPTCRAPCKIPVKRATVLYNGQKIKVQDHLKNGVQHGETIWFFCERKKEKCAYKEPTQCIDGHISIPACFEEYGWFSSLVKTDVANMSPCENRN